MESVNSVKLVTVIFLIQVVWCGIGEPQQCSPGFGSDLFLFRVPRENLQKGTRIGTIVFNDCTGRTHIDFMSTDTQYHVDSDGTVKLKSQVTLHSGYTIFSVHAWDSWGKKHTALVRVEHQDQAENHHGQQQIVDAIKSPLPESSSVFPLLEISKSSSGLKRSKREWVIPPIKIGENARGLFPQQIAMIKSSHAKETKMVYSITGEGVDQPPVGLFTINKDSGMLYVSKPLDREEKHKYQLQTHARSTIDNIQEPAMEIIVEVLDQNDNIPVFTKDLFMGRVPEASKIGFEFMTITATDADDPNTDNGDVRYSIISQDPPQPSPNMFAINSISGAIQVNADGLDREKYSQYSLKIQAADMRGEGRPVTGRVIITVTDSDDKSLVEWVIPPIRVLENERGPFPKGIVQIKTSLDKETKMVYSIRGEGADLPPVGLFTIDRNTGWLYGLKPLDREEKDHYQLQADAYALTGNIQGSAIEVIIEVLDQNDNTPVFAHNPFMGWVPETSKIGFEFMTITATDADDPNTYNADIRYSIISQDPLKPSPNMFAINSVSGAIQVNADGLDRKKYPEYILEIQAADMQGEGRRVTGRAVITVTDSNFKPVVEWLIPPIRVPENGRGPFPMEIVQIKTSHAKITRVKYSISGVGADLPPVGLFLMDKNSGKLYVARALDRETRDEYVLQAYVIGDNIHDEVAEFIIHVVDQNDNKPFFTQEPFLGSVSDASKIGFEFMTISATDADDPNTDNADIRYSIISQTPPEPNPNMFEINPFSGVIRVKAEGLDSKKCSKYVLKIQAADMQGNGLTSIGNAVILITDSKEVTLALSPGTWAISPICFPENARGPFPKQLAQIKSRYVKQAKIMYSITGEGADQPPVGLFTVEKDSGWLSVTKSLDRETKHDYVLQAHATGDGVNEHPIEITIHVIDQNDNKPVFTQNPFSGSVPEVSKMGFEVMTISAIDADDPNTENANIQYSIISQDSALPQPNMFEINPISGVIQVNAEGFDKEKYPEYTLEIQAADMQGNGLQSRGKAVITVTA